jgi:prepilin-type N-terminal cleavage/methylation domain-containing protein
MPKGFSMLELLAVLVVMGFALAVSAGLFPTLLTELPRACQTTDTQRTIGLLLERMQRDVDAARSLPKSFGRASADQTVLLMEQADGVVCYAAEDGGVSKFGLTPGGQRGRELGCWRVPGAAIEWRLWESAGQACAVEVHSGVLLAGRGRQEKKLANARVFFLPASAAEGDRP